MKKKTDLGIEFQWMPTPLETMMMKYRKQQCACLLRQINKSGRGFSSLGLGD